MMLSKSKKKKATVLDRDGVINEMVYNSELGTIDSPLNPKEFRLLTGVAEAIKLFNKMNFLVIVVSNQPAVAKGKTSLKLLEKITEKMERELKRKGAHLDKIYYCLHHPDPEQVKIKKYLKKCNCRKPKPGLLLKAAKELNIDLKKSYMIGDGITDIKAGKAAGCKTIFLGKLKCDICREFRRQKVKPDYIVPNLLAVAKLIKKVEGK